MELAAPPGSDWCGNKKRSQGGEEGTLSGDESTACHRNCKGGNMSGLPSEPLRKGGSMCPYYPYCKSPHGALQCVRLASLTKEHREAIDRDRKVCLRCREQGVDADGTCGRCRDTPAPASEPSPPAAPWPRPDWTVVPEAEADRDFYECIALSGVARFNPEPTRATVKEISILFDYKQEHTILYRRWLDDMDVELLPTEPRTVTTALGRPVETRQIAIIPLPSAKKGGEPVVIGVWVVEQATWSKGTAPMIKNLRERFLVRPIIPRAHTARKPRMIDLVVGRDSPKIFSELAQEARLRQDDFVLCNISFSPGQVVYGYAQESIRWVDSLDNPEDGLKPQFRNQAKGRKRAKSTTRPAEANFFRRISIESSAGQSPRHGLQDDVYGAEGGNSLRGDTPLSFFLGAGLPESVIQREVSTEGEFDFFQEKSVVWKELSEPAAARADLREGLGRGRVVIEPPEAKVPALESVTEFLGHAVDVSMQMVEERSVYYREEEPPVLELEEPPNDWEGESNNGDEAAGEAREQARPTRVATMEERMEGYLRVANPDIPALFPRPAWDLSLRPDADAHDLVRTVDGYGADQVVQEKAEAEYRARREEAKVWRRERDEENRLVLEARARQAQEYSEDIASRVERTMKNEEEARMAELRRVKEAERVQIEEKKRIEEDRQLVEKRREAEKRKKEERKEEERGGEEEGR